MASLAGSDAVVRDRPLPLLSSGGLFEIDCDGPFRVTCTIGSFTGGLCVALERYEPFRACSMSELCYKCETHGFENWMKCVMLVTLLCR